MGLKLLERMAFQILQYHLLVASRKIFKIGSTEPVGYSLKSTWQDRFTSTVAKMLELVWCLPKIMTPWTLLGNLCGEIVDQLRSSEPALVSCFISLDYTFIILWHITFHVCFSFFWALSFSPCHPGSPFEPVPVVCWKKGPGAAVWTKRYDICPYFTGKS